jgi:hypothetical protein
MKMKKSQLREIVRNIVEELCAKGKAYRKKRMAAGEKSSAYLSGRAVKVCKGQIKGEGGFGIGEDAAMKKSAKGMAMYGKQAKMEEDIDAKDGTEFKIKLKHLLQKHATNLEKGKADTEFKLTLKHLLDKHVSKGGEEKDD